VNNRQIVENEYRELIGLIKNASDRVKCFVSANQQSKNLKNKLASSLDGKLQNVQDVMERSLKNMHWDKLVISLFGTTNAGKSTVIETFRILFDSGREQNSDGCIVGDGSSDFTKVYNEYELSIDGCPFILIDVPGIEGNEPKFKEGIEKALSKSHCVFYVHGDDKPLESTLAQKIKSYLGDWVQVYSIFNVRGNVNNYDEPEERETLLTDRVLQIESKIKANFIDCLGDVYKGNVSLQALLAMCAKASFAPSRDDLASPQKKFLKYFGSADNILKFSQFQTLINLVEQKAANFSNEIAGSNILKVRSFKREILKEIETILKETETNQYKIQLEQFESNLKSITDTTNSNFTTRINSLINVKFDVVENNINAILKDSENKKDDLAKCIDELSKNIQNGLQTVIDTEITSWNDYVKRKSEIFDGFDSLLLKPPQVKIKDGIRIDFSNALEKMDVELSDVGGFAAAAGGGALTGSAIGTAVPIVGNIVCAVVGGVVGAASYVGQKAAFGDGGLGEAQCIAKRNLADEKEVLKRRLDKLAKQLQDKVLSQKNIIDQKIQTELETVKQIQSVISDLKTKFQQVKIF
jgi:hypothetical protein